MNDTKVLTPEDVAAKANPQEKPLDPNTDFYNWLNEKNYKVTVEALAGNTPFLPEHGFVLTDKPLLVVKVVKKEDK